MPVDSRNPVRAVPQSQARSPDASPGESDGSTAVSGPITLVQKYLPGGRTVHVQVDDRFSEQEEEDKEEDDNAALSEYEDAGAIVDRSDKGYHGRAASNRVQQPVRSSIIQTRSARALASSSPVDKDEAEGNKDPSPGTSSKRQSASDRSGRARDGGGSSTGTRPAQATQRAAPGGSRPKPVPRKLTKPSNPKVYVVRTDSEEADPRIDETTRREGDGGTYYDRELFSGEADVQAAKADMVPTIRGVGNLPGSTRGAGSKAPLPSSSSRPRSDRDAPQSPRLPSVKRRRVEEEVPVDDVFVEDIPVEGLPVEDEALSDELSKYERSQRRQDRKAKSSSRRKPVSRLSSEPEIVEMQDEEPVLVQEFDDEVDSEHGMDVEEPDAKPGRPSRSAGQGRSKARVVASSPVEEDIDFNDPVDDSVSTEQTSIPHVDLKGKRRASVAVSSTRPRQDRVVQKTTRQAPAAPAGGSRSDRRSTSDKPKGMLCLFEVPSCLSLTDVLCLLEPSRPDVFMAPVPLTLVPKSDTRSDKIKKESTETPRERRTFGVLFGVKKASKNNAQSVGSSTARASEAAEKTLDDLMYHTVVFIPDTCEVTDIQLQDDMLQPHYIGLPPLSAGSFAPWKDYELDGGMLLFSTWGETCPDLDVDSCLNAINFTTHRNYINLCRASLRDVLIKNIPSATTTYHLYTQNRQVAMCLSCVMCTDSNLVEPYTKGLHLYQIRGMFHSQEWERFVGFICSAFGHKALDSQLYMHSISFSTRPPDKESAPGSKTPSTPARPSGSKYASVRSPSVGTAFKSSAAASYSNFSLPFGAPIPIYDCRNVDLNLERDLDRLDKLPRWPRDVEVPVGSFVVVAHTVGVYKAQKSGNWTVALNIQWVMVLGVPATWVDRS